MEKIDYKHGKFVILTSRYDEDGFDWADYEEFCEVNGYTPTKKGYTQWVAQEIQDNYEQDLENIKDCKQYNVPVLITGRLGLWDGSHEIVPVVETSVHSAIKRMLGRDINDIDAEFNDGKIIVNAYHHDGTNTFEIRALSKKGLGYQYSGNDNWQDCHTKRLPYLYAI